MRRLDHLSNEECRRLLASVPVGRIIYTRNALPAVELVNFVLDQGDAFEVDEVDVAGGRGWSVTAIGRSRAVTDCDDIAALRETGLDSWAPGDREHYIRITPGILNGRRLG
jgi:uncharacterized protein